MDFDDAILAEREEGIMAIQRDMTQVNDIFRDLAHLVDEQGNALGMLSTSLVSNALHVGSLGCLFWILGQCTSR